MKKTAVTAGLVLVASLVLAPLASAQTGPDSNACAEAETALSAALAATVEFDPAVYPGDVPPAVAAVTPPLLQSLLDGGELGTGAQAEVQAALAAFTARDEACAEPPATATPTPTPTPPTTLTPAPTTTPGPVDLDCDDVTRAQAQALLSADATDPHGFDVDRDGTACEVDDTGFDQVGAIPVGGVATGGGPA